MRVCVYNKNNNIKRSWEELENIDDTKHNEHGNRNNGDEQSKKRHKKNEIKDVTM